MDSNTDQYRLDLQERHGKRSYLQYSSQVLQWSTYVLAIFILIRQLAATAVRLRIANDSTHRCQKLDSLLFLTVNERIGNGSWVEKMDKTQNTRTDNNIMIHDIIYYFYLLLIVNVKLI